MSYTELPADIASALADLLDALERHGATVSSVEVSPFHESYAHANIHTPQAVCGDVLGFNHATRTETHGKWRFVFHGTPTADVREAFAAAVVSQQREAL